MITLGASIPATAPSHASTAFPRGRIALIALRPGSKIASGDVGDASYVLDVYDLDGYRFRRVGGGGVFYMPSKGAGDSHDVIRFDGTINGASRPLKRPATEPSGVVARLKDETSGRREWVISRNAVCVTLNRRQRFIDVPDMHAFIYTQDDVVHYDGTAACPEIP